jgi:hypothetical protein
MSSFFDGSTAEQYYQPATAASSKDRAATLSKDFQWMEAYLAKGTSTGRDQAKSIYELGSFCQSYAELTLSSPLAEDIPVGLSVTGTPTSTTELVEGMVLHSIPAGSTTLSVRYLSATAAGNNLDVCSVGGNPVPLLDGCKLLVLVLLTLSFHLHSITFLPPPIIVMMMIGFAPSGTLKLFNGTSSMPLLKLGYESYVPLQQTKNALSLQKLSTSLLDGAASRSGTTTTSSFSKLLESYTQYYGSADYADQWIQAAFAGTTTRFKNGNANFSLLESKNDAINRT